MEDNCSWSRDWIPTHRPMEDKHLQIRDWNVVFVKPKPVPTVRTVTFTTSGGVGYKVPVKIASQFRVVKEFYGGDLDRPEVEHGPPFPLKNVGRLIFHRVVYYGWRMREFELNKNELMRAGLFDLPSEHESFEKKVQEFKDEYFGCLSDETIVEVVKAAYHLKIDELLDSAMPRFRKRFGIGDDEDADFVFTDEMEEILRSRRAASSKKRSYTTIPTYEESSDPNPTGMTKFKTSDEKLVLVPVAIAMMFGMVNLFIELGIVWSLETVSSYILNIVVSACKKLLELGPNYDAKEKEKQESLDQLEKERQEFFDQRSDRTIVELVKAADYLWFQELLDFVMPSFRKRFGLEDDKGVKFVYTAEAEAILLRSAPSTSEGASS